MSDSLAVNLLSTLQINPCVMVDLVGHEIQPFVIAHSTVGNFHGVKLRLTNFGRNHGGVHQKQYLFKWGLFGIKTRGSLKSESFDGFLLKIGLNYRLYQFDVYINSLKRQDVGLIHQKIAIFDVNVNLIGNQSDTDAISFA